MNFIEKIESKDSMLAELTSLPTGYQEYLDKLPDDVKLRIKEKNNSLKHGMYTSAPIICPGPQKCIFFERCPIPKRTSGGIEIGELSSYPIGDSCVMEALFIQQKLYEYVDYLEINPENPIEMSIANELALIDLYKNRAAIILSRGDRSGQGADFIKEDATGLDPETGYESKRSQLHPAVELMDRLEKRRERWIDRLLESRKAKIDVAAKMGKVQNDSRLAEELYAIKEALKSPSKAIDVLEIDLD